MTDPDTERLVELDLGVTPEAAISGAALLQSERRAFVTFNAMRPTSKPTPWGGYYFEDAGTAVVELVDCTATKFGYPNDEAWRNIPLTKGRSYGIFEVENSAWKVELARLNRYSFPTTTNFGGRHFLFLFHDSSLECIARELRLELSSAPYRALAQDLIDRFG